MTPHLTELLFCHHRRLSRITRGLALPLELVDIHLLNLISKGQILAGEAARELAVAKSIISRRLELLTKQGFVTSQRDESDGRARTLSLTSLGARTAHLTNLLRSFAAAACIYPLSAAETDELTTLFESLAEGLGAKKRLPTLHSSSLLVALERLSYGFGIISGAFLGQGVSVDEFQLLACLLSQPQPASVLSVRLLISASGLSRILAVLEKAELIQREAGPKDRRTTLVSLTTQGREVTKAGWKSIEDLFAGTLAALGPAENQRLAKLLSKYALSALLPTSVALSGIEIFWAQRARERAALRAFYVIEQSRNDRLLELPEQLFAETSRCIGIRTAQGLQGALEFARHSSAPSLSALLPINEFQAEDIGTIGCSIANAIFIEKADAAAPSPQAVSFIG